MIITIIYIFYKKFLTIRISYPVNKFKVTCQMENRLMMFTLRQLINTNKRFFQKRVVRVGATAGKSCL